MSNLTKVGIAYHSKTKIKNNMSNLIKVGIGLAAVILLTIFSALFIRVAFYNFVDNYEFAYMFDARTGKTYNLINEDSTAIQGYIFSYPFIQHVHTFDTRPVQICIEGGQLAAKRVLNCKLVSFDPKGLSTFIEWHGRDNYSQHDLKDVLMVYAYDQTETRYPFLKFHKNQENYSQNIAPNAE